MVVAQTVRRMALLVDQVVAVAKTATQLAAREHLVKVTLVVALVALTRRVILVRVVVVVQALLVEIQ
jgi:hypothetical protein